MIDATSILREAAASQFGIAVRADHLRSAQNLRRRLYAERARPRLAGATEFDALSVLIKPVPGTPQREVWIIPRPATARPSAPHQSRALGRDELPELIRARGPAPHSAAFLRYLSNFAVDIPSGKKP